MNPDQPKNKSISLQQIRQNRIVHGQSKTSYGKKRNNYTPGGAQINTILLNRKNQEAHT